MSRREEKRAKGTDAEVTAVIEHYQRVVMRGRRDATRTRARAVVAIWLEEHTVEELELAADRYAQELDPDAIPLGARTFYSPSERLVGEYLREDWEPPARSEDEYVQNPQTGYFERKPS